MMKLSLSTCTVSILMLAGCLQLGGIANGAVLPEPVIVRNASYSGRLGAKEADFEAKYTVEVLSSKGERKAKLLSGPVGCAPCPFARSYSPSCK